MACPLSRMQCAVPGSRKGPDGNWVAKCPAHEDGTPSLRFKETEAGGKLLVWCGAGCSVEAIARAAGLEVSDLFPEDESKPAGPVIDTAYDYTDEDGKLLFQVVRYRPKGFKQRRPDPSGGWIWSTKGIRMVPFQLPRVLAAVGASQPVCLVEGEKDALRVEACGLVATTTPKGAGGWHAGYAEPLRGARVVLIPDNDPDGRNYAETAARSLLAVRADVRILLLPVPKKEDVSYWLSHNGSAEELKTLVADAPAWTPESTAEPARPEPGQGSYQKNFEVEKIEKIATRPAIYYVHMMGGKVQMRSGDLGSWPKFRARVIDELNRVPDMRNPNLNWHPYLDELLQTKVEIIAAPEDASEEEMIWYQVTRYIEMKSDEDETALGDYRGVYSNERFFYLHGPTLHKHLSVKGFKVEPSDLWNVLRNHGAESRLKKVLNSEGVRKAVRAWFLEKGVVGTYGDAEADADG